MSLGIALLTAHMVADFPLQTDWMAANKHDLVRAKALHCLVHAIVAYVALSPFARPLTALYGGLFMGVAHFIIDSMPRPEPKEKFPPYPLAVDQTRHVASIYFLVVLLS